MTARRLTAEPQRAPVDGQRYGVAYFRVSTLDQANTSYDDDGFSIQAQRDYCQRKAAELGVQLVDEYTDRGKSARTADRPALQAMLARIKDDTDIQYVFVHKLDRLARNRQDDVQIGLLFAKSGVRLVSCTENIDDSPSGRLVHGIMADIAEWYSANLSEEAKKGMRKKVENGGTPGRVPLGYRNTRLKIIALGKDIGVVEQHETFAPIITECFRLYATGRCTLADVADFANDQGLRLSADKRLPERPLTVQHMQRILRNRYYTGWVQFGGIDYRGEHAALIDAATFDRVQALLTARDSNKDKSHKRPHHLKGTIYCARCGRRLGITMARGHLGGVYPYFFCLGRQADTASCTQGYVAVDEVEDAVRAYWAQVRIPTDRIPALRASILASFQGRHERGQVEIAKLKRRVLALEQRRKKAKAAYYADVLDLDDFKAEQDAIREGVASAELAIAKWTVELDSITRSLDEALQLMANPQALYESVPEDLKVVLVQTVFERIWVLDTVVVGSDLTPPIADLLAREAHLALGSQSGQGTTDRSLAADTESTYHRDRSPDPWTSRPALSAREFLVVERPSGLLAVDRKNLRPRGGRGSKIDHLVGVTGFKLNPELAKFIREHPHDRTQPNSRSTTRVRKWRIRQRLSANEIAKLVRTFKSGTPKRQLAAQYGMGITSMKKLLREEAMKRQSRKNV